jgi:hypothetical protein
MGLDDREQLLRQYQNGADMPPPKTFTLTGNITPLAIQGEGRDDAAREMLAVHGDVNPVQRTTYAAMEIETGMTVVSTGPGASQNRGTDRGL